MICCLFTIIGVRTVRAEQRLKLKYNRGIVKSDIIFTNKVITKLIICAFIGGWVSGALGLGGGAIFNPLLLSMGLPP